MNDILTPQDFFRQKLRDAGFCDDAIEGAQEKAAANAATAPEEKESPSEQQATAALIEGALKAVVADRYERSRAARQACIQAHGATCAICGFDFAKVYGPQFAGIIQVHHIMPLHETGKAHEVDPVRDLIPVCPNCHVALHAKPDGTYTPDELRAIMKRTATTDAPQPE